MSALEAIAILLAGVGAGTINAVVGSGTLITFPTLLFFGVPPLAANVSNTVGLAAGGVTGIHGYRRELSGQGAAVRRLAPASLLGALAGGLLLLILPAAAFAAIVPVLIALALILVLAGPALQRRAAARRTEAGGRGRRALMVTGVFGSGIYGGYFGAAQGVLLVGLLGALSTEPLQRVNALKNVLGSVVNLVAALLFVAVAREQVHWGVAGLLAVGALIGGYVGARVGRRLSPTVLRALITVIGLVAIGKFVFS